MSFREVEVSGTLVSHEFEEFCLEQEAGGRYQNRHLYNDILKARTEYGCERLVLDIPLAGPVYHNIQEVLSRQGFLV